MNMDSFDMILTIAALVMGAGFRRDPAHFWNSHRSGYGDQELCVRYHLSGSSNCYLHYHGSSDSQEM